MVWVHRYGSERLAILDWSIQSVTDDSVINQNPMLCSWKRVRQKQSQHTCLRRSSFSLKSGWDRKSVFSLPFRLCQKHETWVKLSRFDRIKLAFSRNDSSVFLCSSFMTIHPSVILVTLQSNTWTVWSSLLDWSNHGRNGNRVVIFSVVLSILNTRFCTVSFCFVWRCLSRSESFST